MDDAALQEHVLQQCSDKLDELNEKIDGQIFAYDISLDEWLTSSLTATATENCMMPVSFHFNPYEPFSAADMLLSKNSSTDNELLRKTLAVLASLLIELKTLNHEARTKFVSALEFYGQEFHSSTASSSASESHQHDLSLSRLIPTFLHLSAFQQRCGTVLQNAVMQLAGLCALQSTTTTKSADSTEKVHNQAALLPHSLIDGMCDTFYTLATIDYTIAQNVILNRDFANFQRLIQNVQLRPNVEQEFIYINHQRLRLAENVMRKLHVELFEKGLFYSACMAIKVVDGTNSSTGMQILFDRWQQDLWIRLNTLDSTLRSCTNTNTGTLTEHRKLSSLIFLFIMQQYIFSTSNENSYAGDLKTFQRRFLHKFLLSSDSNSSRGRTASNIIIKKLPIICLGTGHWIDAVEFFISKLPPEIFSPEFVRKVAKISNDAKIALFTLRRKSLARDVAHLRLLAYEWLTMLKDTCRMPPKKLFSNSSSSSSNNVILIQFCDNVLLRGVTLARQLSMQILALHLLPISSNNSDISVENIMHACETLLCIHLAYRQYAAYISIWCQDVTNLLCDRLQTLLANYVQKIKTDIVNSSASTQQSQQQRQKLLEILSHLHLILQLLQNGPPSPVRLTCIKLAFDLLPTIASSPQEIQTILRQLMLLTTLQTQRVQYAVSFNAFYWHRQKFVPLILDSIVRAGGDAGLESALKLQSFAQIYRFTVEQHAPLLSDAAENEWRKCIEAELYEMLCTKILQPVCEHIEMSLRLYAAQQLPTPLPASSTNNFFSINFCKAVVALPPLRIGAHAQLVCRTFIEQYLSQTFYNFIAGVAPHDWKVYECQMACAAERLYCGLKILPSNLPQTATSTRTNATENSSGGADDLLQLMRRIHVFVETYFYNLNAQIFIEKESSTPATSKYLNTISVVQVGNSVRMHGSGIVNTSINYAYQYVKRKLLEFSSFLHDERIRAQLQREYHQHVVKVGGTGGGRYAYERAAKLNRNAERLSSTATTAAAAPNLMLKFRQLVTCIGNALAFVRLVRAGEMRATHEQAQFVPPTTLQLGTDDGDKTSDASIDAGSDNDEDEEELTFEKMCCNEGYSSQTQRVAEQLDAVIANCGRHRNKNAMKNNNFQSKNYLRLFVDTIAPEMRVPTTTGGDNNVVDDAADKKKDVRHLQNFFLLVPALTINFVEYLLTCKDKLQKRAAASSSSSNDSGQFCAIFSDDGFAMGVAYLLALLGQFEKFDALMWLDEVDDKYKRERAALVNNNAQQQQTSILTLKRLDSLRREYELLMYTLSSAKVFFTGESLALKPHAKSGEQVSGSSNRKRQANEDDESGGNDAVSVSSTVLSSSRTATTSK